MGGIGTLVLLRRASTLQYYIRLQEMRMMIEEDILIYVLYTYM